MHSFYNSVLQNFFYMFRAVKFHHQEVSIMLQCHVKVHGLKCVQVVL